MERPTALSRSARGVFAFHLVLAIAIGTALLVAPATFCGWFGYEVGADAKPVLCALGALLLGVGGLTSLFGLLARSWEQVDYILRIEVLYLALQTAAFVVFALTGRGPALANWLFAALSGLLFSLFSILYLLRPGQAPMEPQGPMLPRLTNANKRA